MGLANAQSPINDAVPSSAPTFNGTKSPNPKQFALRARATSHTETSTHSYSSCDETERPLSIAFHINNAKSIRIKLDVSMSLQDVVKDIWNHSECKSNQSFHLRIMQSTDRNQIIVPFENSNMTFWELIVEFGILDLLHFDICVAQSTYTPKKQEKDKRDKKSSGLW